MLADLDSHLVGHCVRVGQDAPGAQWGDHEASCCALGLLQDKSMDGRNSKNHKCQQPASAHLRRKAAGELDRQAGQIVATQSQTHKPPAAQEAGIPTWCICHGWLKLGLQAPQTKRGTGVSTGVCMRSPSACQHWQATLPHAAADMACT